MFKETETKQFDIIRDIDKWEYKNITEKNLSENIFTGEGGIDNSNEKMGAIGVDDAYSVNVKILDAIYRRDLDKEKCSVPGNKAPIHAEFKKESKAGVGGLQSRKGNFSQAAVSLNEKTTTRLLNQEVLNEIYYKKSWDAFLASKTDQELELAHKFSVSTYKANNDLNKIPKKSHAKTLEIIDSRILDEKRTNIKNNIMMSYKNLKGSLD